MGSGGGGLKCFLGNPTVLDSLFSDGNPSFGAVSFDGSPSLLLDLLPLVISSGLLIALVGAFSTSIASVGVFTTSIALVGVFDTPIGVADIPVDPLEAVPGFEGPVPYGGTPPGGTVKFDLRRDL